MYKASKCGQIIDLQTIYGGKVLVYCNPCDFVKDSFQGEKEPCNKGINYASNHEVGALIVIPLNSLDKC